MLPPKFSPPVKPASLIKPPTSKPPVSKPGVAAHVAKTFSVKPWSGSNEGKKVLVYGPNGMGKTTLAAMAPNPIFIGLDDGGRETTHPKTDEPLNAIGGIETFADLRDALHQHALFSLGTTVVLDTMTKAEHLIEAEVLRTIKNDGGQYVENIEAFGWGKGYKHMCDLTRLLLTDFDPLIRKGVNLILLAQQSQATVANLEGTDYAQDGPMLTSQPKSGANVRSEVCAWVDNIFRVGYPEVSVVKANKQASKGKASGSTERVIYTEPAVYFVAKNRMNGKLPPVVSFSQRDDDSLWQFVFGGATQPTETA